MMMMMVSLMMAEMRVIIKMIMVGILFNSQVECTPVMTTWM